MAALTQAEKDLLGPLIEPFERSNKSPDRKILRDGETENVGFATPIHDGIQNGTPPNHVELSEEEINTHIKTKGRFKEKCFLWIIDETSVKISRELNRNSKRTHDPECVCHSNLSGGGKAYIGGEMFFGVDGRIYINYFSDRYGNPSSTQWAAAKKHIESVGYTNLTDIIELLKEA